MAAMQGVILLFLPNVTSQVTRYVNLWEDSSHERI